jgi:hypothetical protein
MNILSQLNKLYLKEGILKVRIARNRRAHKAMAITQHELMKIKTKILRLEMRAERKAA